MKKQILDGIEIYSIDLKKKWSIIKWVAIVLALGMTAYTLQTAYIVIKYIYTH